MTYPNPFNIARRIVPGIIPINKFGINLAVSTVFVPVSSGGTFRMPQATAPVNLRMRAGNAADTPGGAGAGSVIVNCISPAGELVSLELPTNGAAAGATDPTDIIRATRFYVGGTGTYALNGTGFLPASHVGDLVIEDAATGDEWGRLEINADLPRGQSQTSQFCVRNAGNLYISNITVGSDETGRTDILGLQRRGALDVTAPYQPFRVFFEEQDLAGAFQYTPDMPLGPFPANTDIGFWAKTNAGTRPVSVRWDGYIVAEPAAPSQAGDGVD